MMKKSLLTIGIVCVFTIFMAYGSAMAGDVPGSKAAAAISELIDLSIVAPDDGDPADTGWNTILTTYIKTPNQKELAFDVALQCGLITDTTVKSKGGEKDISSAEGSISVRVMVTDADGNVRYARPLEEGNSDLGVTYCDRFQQLDARFAGLNCYAAPPVVFGFCDTTAGQCISGNVGANCTENADCNQAGGVEGTCEDGTCTAGKLGYSCVEDDDCDLAPGEVFCLDPEELRLLLETLNANAFNFLLSNVAPGVQKIEVQARAKAGVDISGTAFGEAQAEAFVGLGSMLVETVRLIKGAEDTFELE